MESSLLPNFYLAYCTSAAGESGKVHSTVKERWLQRDPELVDGMLFLASLADRAVESIQNRDVTTLAFLMVGGLFSRFFPLFFAIFVFFFESIKKPHLTSSFPT